jgi:D-lactate dehydrogenase (cytochrome)
MRNATEAVYRLAQHIGGSIEYVHGVGIRLGHLMEQELGDSWHTLRTLKVAFDPDNIMNPGKLGLVS